MSGRRRGTEDRREEQQGEGKRRRNAIPKAVGTWRPLQDLGLSSERLEDIGGPEQRGQNLTWLKSTPPPHPGVSVVLNRLLRGCGGSFLLPREAQWRREAGVGHAGRDR